jgi:hypothetical protein
LVGLIPSWADERVAIMRWANVFWLQRILLACRLIGDSERAQFFFDSAKRS